MATTATEEVIPGPGLSRCETTYHRKHYLQTRCELYGAYLVVAYGTLHRYCRKHAQQAALNAADAGCDVTIRRI